MFQPCGNLVTVVLDEKESKTKGGLHLPDTFDGVFITGTVRATGPGLWDSGCRHSLDLRPGDKVMIAQHQRQVSQHDVRVMPYPSFMDDGQIVSIMDASDILGVIERIEN